MLGVVRSRGWVVWSELNVQRRQSTELQLELLRYQMREEMQTLIQATVHTGTPESLFRGSDKCRDFETWLAEQRAQERAFLVSERQRQSDRQYVLWLDKKIAEIDAADSKLQGNDLLLSTTACTWPM